LLAPTGNHRILQSVSNRKHLKKGSSRIAIERTECRTARSHVHDHIMIERDGWHTRRCSLISIVVVTSGTPSLHHGAYDTAGRAQTAFVLTTNSSAGWRHCTKGAPNQDQCARFTLKSFSSHRGVPAPNQSTVKYLVSEDLFI
jgi:hypothetical protein